MQVCSFYNKYTLLPITSQALCKLSDSIFAKQLGSIDGIVKIKVGSLLSVSPLVFTEGETVSFISHPASEPYGNVRN